MKDVSHDHELEVRADADMVIMEPPPIYGVRGFSVYLTSEQAKKLGYKLISAAVKALPPTVKGSGE